MAIQDFYSDILSGIICLAISRSGPGPLHKRERETERERERRKKEEGRRKKGGGGRVATHTHTRHLVTLLQKDLGHGELHVVPQQKGLGEDGRRRRGKRGGREGGEERESGTFVKI